MRELRPVTSIACLIALAFHPAIPKLNIKKITMRAVTQVVNLHPFQFITVTRKHYFAPTLSMGTIPIGYTDMINAQFLGYHLNRLGQRH